VGRSKGLDIDLIWHNLETIEPYIIEDDFARIYAIYEEVRDKLLGISAGPSVSKTSMAKLPRINLPTFSIKYENWEVSRIFFPRLRIRLRVCRT
jgi:hypothetical protein